MSRVVRCLMVVVLALIAVGPLATPAGAVSVEEYYVVVAKDRQTLYLLHGYPDIPRIEDLVKTIPITTGNPALTGGEETPEGRWKVLYKSADGVQSLVFTPGQAPIHMPWASKISAPGGIYIHTYDQSWLATHYMPFGRAKGTHGCVSSSYDNIRDFYLNYSFVGMTVYVVPHYSDILKDTAVTKPATGPAQPTQVFFSETGHGVANGFLNFWYEHGGLPLFGYPISDELQEKTADGQMRTVQYFERARFEYYPEFAGTPYEVQLGLLGTEVSQGRDFGHLPTLQSTRDRLYFDPTGHTLSYGFLSYWLQNGGLKIFGYPISEEFLEVNKQDGQIYTVQYFERARFEYHPEFAGTPYEVELGHLGRAVSKPGE